MEQVESSLDILVLFEHILFQGDHHPLATLII